MEATKPIELKKDYVELFEGLEPKVRVEAKEAIQFLTEVGVAFLIGIEIDKVDMARKDIEESLKDNLPMKNLTVALLELYRSEE